MATKSIGTAGTPTRDYSSIAGYITYLQGLTFTEDEVGEFYNDGEFTFGATQTFGSISTGSYTVTCRPAAGEGFMDNGVTRTLWPDASDGVLWNKNSGSSDAIAMDNGNIIFEGLQIIKTTGYNDVIECDNNVSGREINGCIIMGQAYGSGTKRVIYGARNMTIENSLLIQNQTGGTLYAIQGSYGTCTVSACTIVRTATAAGTGVTKGSATFTCNNVASFGFSTGFGASIGGDYNASDDTTGPGANSQDSLTYADQFEDVTYNADYTLAASDMRAKSSGTLNGNGNSGTLPSTDIYEQTRSEDYIGAHEVASAATANPKNPLGHALKGPLGGPIG
jgi:hypothetical protein